MRTLRALVVVAVSCGATALGTGVPSALAPRGNDPCGALVALEERVDDLESSQAFDAAGYRRIGKDYRKAAKDVPKELRSDLRKIAKLYTSIGKSKSDNDALNAYGNGLVKYDKELTRLNTYYEESCSGTASGGPSGGSGAGGGTLTLGSETIALESSRCYLQEQTAAGQKILWTAQASGTNAAGDQVVIDVSRYDASSDFAGDDLSIDIGDPRDPSFVEWNGRYTSGVIFLSGKTVSASALEIDNDELATETASFEISC